MDTWLHEHRLQPYCTSLADDHVSHGCRGRLGSPLSTTLNFIGSNRFSTFATRLVDPLRSGHATATAHRGRDEKLG